MVEDSTGGACLGLGAMAIADSKGMERECSVSVFMDIDGLVATGRTAEISGRIWPERFLADPLAISLGTRQAEGIWRHVDPGNMVLHCADSIMQPLNGMRRVALSAPYPLVSLLRTAINARSQQVIIVPRVMAAYHWTRARYRPAVRTPRILVLDECNGVAELCMGVDEHGESQSARMKESKGRPSHWVYRIQSSSALGDFALQLDSLLAAVGVTSQSPCQACIIDDSACSSLLANYQSWCSEHGISARIAAHPLYADLRTIAAAAADMVSDEPHRSGPSASHAEPQDLCTWLRGTLISTLPSVVNPRVPSPGRHGSPAVPSVSRRKIVEAIEIMRRSRELSPEQMHALYSRLDSLMTMSDAETERFCLTLMRIAVGGRPELRTVALISPFSCGKSTLINAMIGRPILNVDERAETSCPIRVLNSERFVILAEYRDRLMTKEFATAATLADAVGSLASVRAASTGSIIQCLHVGLPLPAQIQRFELMDTPGYYSRWEGHDVIADSAWRDADLVITLIDPTSVGDEHFTAKMKDIAAAGKSMIYAISKIDMHPESASQTRHELRLALGDSQVNAISVSGYQALKARMWQSGLVPIDELRRDHRLFAIENDEQIRGRLLLPRHIELMLRLSNIDALENEILRLTGAIGGVGIGADSSMREARVPARVS